MSIFDSLREAFTDRGTLTERRPATCPECLSRVRLVFVIRIGAKRGTGHYEADEPAANGEPACAVCGAAARGAGR